MTAEEERRAPDGAGDEPTEAGGESTIAELGSSAEREVRRLHGGRTVSLLGAAVPVRLLVALAIFVAVFTVLWAALWAALGTLGLALGWIPAAIAGGYAITLFARRA